MPRNKPEKKKKFSVHSTHSTGFIATNCGGGRPRQRVQLRPVWCRQRDQLRQKSGVDIVESFKSPHQMQEKTIFGTDRSRKLHSWWSRQDYETHQVSSTLHYSGLRLLVQVKWGFGMTFFQSFWVSRARVQLATCPWYPRDSLLRCSALAPYTGLMFRRCELSVRESNIQKFVH